MMERVAQVLGKMNGGGVESVVMNYYRHIDRERVQFDFIVDSDSTLIPRAEIESLGGRVFEVVPYQKQPKNLQALERLFRSGDWKIVHSHMNSLSFFSLRAAKQAAVPVRIAHSHSTWGRGEWKRNLLKAVLKTQANRYPTHKMACGEYAGEWLYGKNSRYTVLRNAVDMASFLYSVEKRAEVRNALGISQSTFVVGHIGRFMKQKNHARLVKIFNKLHRSVPNSVLLLAGMGPLLDDIKQQVRSLGLEECVKFLGQRSDSEALYSAFDCFCLPSLYEGLPVVSVEAQMAGLPIVLSNRVSSEALITKKSISIPLDASDDVWADALFANRDASRQLDDSELQMLKPYDIVQAAPILLSYYESSLNQVQRVH